MSARPKNVVQIYGSGGMGKTLYLKAMVRTRIGAGGRVVTIDPNGTFEGGRYGHSVSVSTALRALDRVGGEPIALVIRPEWDEDVTDVFRAVYEAGSILLAVDEAADFGGRGMLDKNLLRVVQKGRNRRVDVATTCQNTTDLDSRIRLNFSVAIAFRQPNPDSAHRWAVEYAARPELASGLQTLPPFHYVRATAGGEVARGRVPDPGVHGSP